MQSSTYEVSSSSCTARIAGGGGFVVGMEACSSMREAPVTSTRLVVQLVLASTFYLLLLCCLVCSEPLEMKIV